MDKDKQPGIRFDGIMLTNESFWRDFDVPHDSKPSLEFEMGWNQQGDNYFTELTTILTLTSDDKDVLTLKFAFVGLFSVVRSSENMDIEHYIKNNSPALMFPYIREHISHITQKSGIKPVLLPPINIVALVKHIEK